jgi:hypothetical protein
MNDCILALIAPLSIENDLVDWLLDYRADIMFSTERVNCYGMPHDTLDAAQQVLGHQAKIFFQLQLPANDAKDICTQLQKTFDHSAIRYWIIPTLETGYIGSDQLDACRPEANDGTTKTASQEENES